MSISSFSSEIHQRTEADRKFACKLCPQKFFTAKNLRNHQKVHSAVRCKLIDWVHWLQDVIPDTLFDFSFSAYKCRYCDQTYKYSGDLTTHLKTHLGNIHECQQCLKRFRYAKELQKHEFEHYKEEKEAKKVEGSDQ